MRKVMAQLVGHASADSGVHALNLHSTLPRSLQEVGPREPGPPRDPQLGPDPFVLPFLPLLS